LAAFQLQNVHPPSTSEVPALEHPSETEIVLAEETPSGFKNIYRGTVGSAEHDLALLENVMPLWLMQYVLSNKTPTVPNIKISFGVALWVDKTDSTGSSSSPS